MKLIGYYSIISSLILSDRQNFQSEFTGYNFGINKDKFYYADLDADKDKVYILDDTIKFMRSKYYNKKYDIR